MSPFSSSSKQPPFHWPQVYLGVALTTLATLILELSITRIFSVVFYYHFAFLAISIALFGLGAGGVFSYVVAGWRGNLFSKLGGLAFLNSLAAAGALVFVLSRGSEFSNWTLAIVYFTSALPFFLSGAVVSLVIAETIGRVGRVYFFDLAGAGAGCLILVPLLNTIGGPNTVLASSVLYAAAAGIWYNQAGRSRFRAASVALALVTVALVVYNIRFGVIDVKFAKGQKLENERYVKWNSFSRVAVRPAKGSDWMEIFIDADASTGIPKFDFDHLTENDRQLLLGKGPGLPYRLRPGAKTLIIGAGGGWDVARALASGSRDITGVEINPIIARTIMQRRFPHYSRNLYSRPGVRIHVEDGRKFVRRTREKYQVLQATLVDTWASTAAGAFALSENSLYTTEAFRDYLSRLTDDGLLSFTRWGLEPPRESLRLISLAMEALRQLGEHEAWRHVVVAREGTEQDLAAWGATDTVLISRKPFPAGDLARVREAAGEIQLVYVPGERKGNPFDQLLLSPSPGDFQAGYAFNISPVTDDRPFFFYTVQPRDVWEFVTRASRQTADYKVNRAVPLLFSLVGISLAATVVILALPPFLLGSRLPREPGTVGFLLYFVALGAGYILIQVALIQKLVLFLGHPTYALTVVIFTMLVASGVGSYFSRRLLDFSVERLSAALAGVAMLVAALAVILSPLSAAGVGWPLWLKIAVTVLLVGTPAFLMGMPFPTGLAMLELRHSPSVRLAWSLNAAASVLGSVNAVVLAIYLGLQNTLLVGGGLYVGALLIVRLTAMARAKALAAAEAAPAA